MDRAEAIKLMEGWRDTAIRRRDAVSFDMAVAALREQEQRKWISVKERLPKNGEMALCKTMYFYEVLQWDGISEVWCSRDRICGMPYVTHWMPLPEPPEGGAEE